jgi:hypothetical protein
MEDLLVTVVVGTMVGSIGLVFYLLHRQNEEHDTTGEMLASEGWSDIPPNDATRLQEPAFEVWSWVRQRNQRVLETHDNTTYERNEFIGSDVSVAIRCPQQPAQGLLAPVDTHLSRNALYRSGMLWLEQPASKIDIAISQQQARLVGVALCRTEGDAALPELCRRARPGQPGSSYLVVPLLALESDDESLSTLAKQWAACGVFRTLIGTNRRHGPVMSKVTTRILNAATKDRHDMLLALLRTGQPLLLKVAFSTLERWPQVGNKMRPEDICKYAQDLYEPEAVRLICRIAATLPGQSAKEALVRLIQESPPQALYYAAEELARVDLDATVGSLLQRTNSEDDAQTMATVITALGLYADVNVVMQIRELSEGLLTSAMIRSAANDAIDQIQARARADAGQVSLISESSGGEVSMASSESPETQAPSS